MELINMKECCCIVNKPLIGSKCCCNLDNLLKQATAIALETLYETDTKLLQFEAKLNSYVGPNREPGECSKGYVLLVPKEIKSKNYCCNKEACNQPEYSYVLTQEDFNKINTIYEILYCFDLDRQTITLPEGCILKFNGGKLNNSTIICNNTDIQGVTKFEDTGTAIYEGTFNKGLILIFDNQLKFWDGDSWQPLALDSLLLNIDATVENVESTSIATANVQLKGGTFAFSFGLPKGSDGINGTDGVSIKGDKGDPGPKGDKGDPGSKGDPGDVSAVTRYVLVYKHFNSDQEVITPEGGNWDASTDTVTCPIGWQLTTNGLLTPVYQSNALFHSTKGMILPWSTPIRITGEDGVNGTDGRSKEYIYKLSLVELINYEDLLDFTPKSNYPNIDDYVPISEGWSDHPNGISSDIKYEYCSIREFNKDTKLWGNWSIPTLWASYGREGRDGDGVEYVFLLLSKESNGQAPDLIQSVDSPEFQLNEYLPSTTSPYTRDNTTKWTDDPSGVSTEWKYEWVAQRKYNWDKGGWQPFSTPALWAFSEKGEPGEPGTPVDYQIFVFKQSNTKPQKPTGISKHPDGWQDVPTSEGILWLSVGKVNGETELVTEWSEPVKATGEDGKDGTSGADGGYIDFKYAKNNSSTSYPTWSATGPGNNWSDVPPSLSTGEYLWMTTAYRDGSGIVQGNWSTPVRISGEQGPQGTGLNILGSLDSESQLPTTGNVGDAYLINGNLYVWDGDSWENVGTIQGPPGETYQLFIRFVDEMPPVFDESNNYGNDPGKYMGTLVVSSTNMANINDPNSYTWVKIKGEDGFGYEYIYKRNTANEPYDVPGNTASNYQDDDYVPEGWTDNPEGPDETNKYEFCCYRMKKDGTWGPFTGKHSNPNKSWLYAMFAESVPGETGKQGPIIYPAGEWLNGQTYTKDENKVPYVVHNNEYWLLTAKDNSSTGIEPGSSSDTLGDWTKMDKYSAVYTEILLANLANVGKMVFNGDYMFSLTGVDGNKNFLDFNASDPFNLSNSFIPAYCVNLVTGEVWSGRGGVNFKPDGSGYLANGSIKFTSDGSFTITPVWATLSPEITPDIFSTGTTLNIDKYRYFDCVYDTGSSNIYENILLPAASNYNGVELHFRDIRTKFTGTSSGNVKLNCNISFKDAASGGLLNDTYFYIIPHYSNDIVIKSNGDVWVLDQIGTINIETYDFYPGTTFEATGQGIINSSGTKWIKVLPESTIIFSSSGTFWVDAANEDLYTHCHFIILPGKTATINSFAYSASDVSLHGGCIIHHKFNLYYYYKLQATAP